MYVIRTDPRLLYIANVPTLRCWYSTDLTEVFCDLFLRVQQTRTISLGSTARNIWYSEVAEEFSLFLMKKFQVFMF